MGLINSGMSLLWIIFIFLLRMLSSMMKWAMFVVPLGPIALVGLSKFVQEKCTCNYQVCKRPSSRYYCLPLSYIFSIHLLSNCTMHGVPVISLKSAFAFWYCEVLMWFSCIHALHFTQFMISTAKKMNVVHRGRAQAFEGIFLTSSFSISSTSNDPFSLEIKNVKPKTLGS